MARIAVVGAGAAGLAAAWALRARGAGVTLYEGRDAAGGLLRTELLDGVRVDVAVQFLGSYYRETLRLAREAGAGELLVRAPGRDALWRGGRAHGVSYGSAASLVASSALPPRLKLRLATRYLAFLRRNAAFLDPSEPVRAAMAGLDGESIAAWGERELGEDFVELLVYPQLGAYFGTVPEETSAGFYHALAHAGLDARIYAIRGGVGELAGALLDALVARGVEYRSGVDVQRVEGLAGGGWGIDDGGGGGGRFDGVVLAVPPAVALGIAPLPEPLRNWLGGVRRNSTASLALFVQPPVAVDFFGLSFPRGEAPGDRLVALCVQDRKGAGMATPDTGAILAYPSPSIAATISESRPEEVLDRLLPAAEQAFPGLSDRVRRARLFRFPGGATVFYPGYLQHLGRFDAAWLPGGLALAGDYLVAPTVEGAVRSGLKAAARLIGPSAT